MNALVNSINNACPESVDVIMLKKNKKKSSVQIYFKISRANRKKKTAAVLIFYS